ncbi:MAG: hypothetical protein UGF89_06595 [Acutalibacteraceae bacterium]|nr:hypothetical protein [Acutalibacteraceae bacterium]
MKNETTKRLEQLIHGVTTKLSTFGCFEVTIGWHGKERVDYLTYDTNGVFKCYEIKSSVEDFHSGAAHTFVGHYNYYVLTQEVYDAVKDEVPFDVGVYIEDRIVKGAKRRKLAVEENVLRDSLIRSLHRESEKLYNLSDESYGLHIQTELKGSEKEVNRLKAQWNDLLLFIYRKFGYGWQFDFDEYYLNTTKKEREKNISEETTKARNILRAERRKSVRGETLEEKERRIYKYVTRFE